MYVTRLVGVAGFGLGFGGSSMRLKFRGILKPLSVGMLGAVLYLVLPRRKAPFSKKRLAVEQGPGYTVNPDLSVPTNTRARAGTDYSIRGILSLQCVA